LAAVVLPGGRAAAQSSGCGVGPALGTAQVTIDEPSDGDTVSGRVTVRGRARANIGQLSRVEGDLGGKSTFEEYDPSTTLDFELTFDVRNVAPGEAVLSVTACGSGNLTGALARGVAEMTVQVEAPVTSTTASRTSSSLAVPAGTFPGGTSTTVGVTTTRAGNPATGSSSTVAANQTAEPPLVLARPDPVRPKTGSDAPLVLTESPDSGSPRPPLWVGAVVGISGGLGLLFSASSSRRRGRLPEPAEPVDPDLVEVG
jgi:hypothetical protein